MNEKQLDQLVLAREVCFALNNWKRVSEQADRHPGSVTPEEIAAQWERVEASLEAWDLAQ